MIGTSSCEKHKGSKTIELGDRKGKPRSVHSGSVEGIKGIIREIRNQKTLRERGAVEDAQPKGSEEGMWRWDRSDKIVCVWIKDLGWQSLVVTCGWCRVSKVQLPHSDTVGGHDLRRGTYSTV